MVKAVALALALSFLLWVFFYLPKRLKNGPGARFRFVVFSVFALAFAFILIKAFL
ncbi:MAG: hypothetical protein JST06_11970 [Bacteroidetes bacterium]|nr:hypothetical protein [Bacteroidota bacterium]MBS1630108.1 hypothetical protein [Bacteroidota bacterium]